MALRSQSQSGELVAFSIFFLSGIWYMLFGIVSTRSSISQEVGEVRRLFNVRGWNAFSKVYVLAVLPGAVTGGITAIAAEWNASIVAERFTSTAVGSGAILTTVGTGLGKLLDVALANGQIWIMLLGLINLTIVIIVIDRLLWRRLYNRIESVYR
jgi:NitT/TauT family transport system permease protein